MNLYESISNELERAHTNLPEIHSIFYQAVENLSDNLGRRFTVNETNHGLSEEGRPNTYNIFDDRGKFALRIEISSEGDNYKFQLIHPEGTKLGYVNLPKSLNPNEAVSKVESILIKALVRAGEEYNRDLTESFNLKESLSSSIEGVTDAMYYGNVDRVINLVKQSLGDTKEGAQEAFVDMYNMYAKNGLGPRSYKEALNILMEEFPNATQKDEKIAGVIAQDRGNKKFPVWSDFGNYEFD